MEEEYLRIILESEYFNAQWYTENYPEVRLLGISPAEHYLRYGSRLSYNPSASFSTEHYLRSNEDVRKTNIPALLHFELNGKREGRTFKRLPPSLAILRNSLVNSSIKNITPTMDMSQVSVLLPVYNGFHHLERLLPRLIKNTNPEAEIIIVDDASPDPRIKGILDDFEEYPNVRVVKNNKNLGFTGSVNKAAQLARKHFCLLNSDTDVPHLWLERLMRPIIESKDKVASTTPFSNAATIFSFPKWLVDNEESSEIGIDELDELFKQNNAPSFVRLDCPTGVGFCMGINGDLWRLIGGFDEEAFGKGYGEENDWCQRAITYGFKNMLVPDLFVVHAHGGSFPSEEKAKLIQKNAEVLSKRWPNYDEQIQRFIRTDEWGPIRSQIIGTYALRVPTVVVLDHGLGGGANSYFNKNKENHLREGRSVTRIYYDNYLHMFILEINALDGTARFSCSSYKDLFSFLNEIRVDYLEVNNLVGWPELVELISRIASLVEAKSPLVRFLVHDFFSVCGSYTLIDEVGNFCNIPKNLDVCAKCIQNNKLAVSRTNPSVWREQWKQLLSKCDEIVAFSPSSRDLFLKAFPEFADTMVVRPHQPIGPLRSVKRSGADRITLAVVGNLSFAKGAAVLKNLIEWADKSKIDSRFVIFGEIDPAYGVDSRLIEYKGKYEREELPELMEKYGVTCCLVPSICPETFSYVTQELIMMDMPVICFDLGGQADQVREYVRGRVLKSHAPEELWQAIVGMSRTFSNLIIAPTPTA